MVPGTGPVHTPNIRRSWWGDPRLLVVAAAVLWGTTGTAQALGPDDASPTAVGAARLIIGGALLGIVAGARGWLRGGGRRWAVGHTLLAAAAMAAYQPLFFGGVARTGVAVGTVVGIGSAPVFAGLLGAVGRGERPGPRWLLSTGLAIVGTTLLVGSGDPADVDPVGVLMALGAGASYAVYVLATKLLLDAGHPSNAVVAVTFVLAGALLVPVAVLAGVGAFASVDGVLMLAHLGVLTVAVAYLLFGRGLSGVGVGTAGTLTLAEPATAATLGLLVLGERPGPVAIVGLLMIGAGLVLMVSIDRGPVRRSDETGQRGRSIRGG